MTRAVTVRPRDEVEIRPPGRDKVFIEDFDEIVAYRYGKAWLHVEQMNDFDFYLAVYGEGKERLHLNVHLGTKGTGMARVTTYENGIEYDAKEWAAALRAARVTRRKGEK